LIFNNSGKTLICFQSKKVSVRLTAPSLSDRPLVSMQLRLVLPLTHILLLQFITLYPDICSTFSLASSYFYGVRCSSNLILVWNCHYHFSAVMTSRSKHTSQFHLLIPIVGRV